MTVDLEARLRLKLPEMFQIFGNNNLNQKQWNLINSNFEKEYHRRLEIYKENPETLFEVNLYGLISSLDSIEGNFAFFDMLKNVLKGLNSKLPSKGKVQLKKTLYQILINFDHKYRNFIGELLILNNFIVLQNYELKGIEVPITDTTFADFELYSIAEDKNYLLEVVNIHINENHQNLEEFIRGKLETKILNKIKGQEMVRPFYIAPVIWASHKDLLRVEAIYKTNFEPIPNVLVPCAFATYRKNLTDFQNDFGSITTLFRGYTFTEDGYVINNN